MVPQVELILERERMTNWEKNYFVSLIIKIDNWLQKIISFILDVFGNTHHPCDPSKYKERNQDIYSTVMVRRYYMTV